MKEIIHDGVLLARIGNIWEAPQGVLFYSEPKDVLQYGVCVHDAQTKLQPHIHLSRERVPSHRTYEFFYVVSGGMMADFYTENKKYISSVKLSPGDWVALHEGGHGFTVLCDNTRFIEVKSGQFIGVVQDKERF